MLIPRALVSAARVGSWHEPQIWSHLGGCVQKHESALLRRTHPRTTSRNAYSSPTAPSHERAVNTPTGRGVSARGQAETPAQQ